MKTLNVCINGGAGRIAYSLIPLFGNGLVFGPKARVNLNLIESMNVIDSLTGTVLEIQDSAFQHMTNCHMNVSSKHALTDADVCIFIASAPHTKGMERNDLLKANLQIYKNLALNINRYASKNCKIVMVANPVNSLTSIVSQFAPRIPTENFTALSRLDYNRARGIIAKKCGVNPRNVKNLTIWGNHADTMFADASRVIINGVSIKDILDSRWIKKDFVDYVACRWKQIVDTRGVTSIMSPASAIKDHIRDWYLGTEEDNTVSMGVISDGKHYGVPKGMCFSLPCKTKNFQYEVCDYAVGNFTQNKIKLSIDEIKKEVESVGFKF